MVRSTRKNPRGQRSQSKDASAAEPFESGHTPSSAAKPDAAAALPDGQHPRRNGGWREIEALREKAALKASLADVWDEDFDLDEEILAELDHTAEFFTTEEDPDEGIFEDDEEVDDYFDEEDV